MSAKIAKDNRLLLINPNNVMKQPRGYFAVPWAFKKVINKVLNPRELAVYVQIGFYMDKYEVCYPSLNDLAEDMQRVSRGSQLSGIINSLVNKGFLLKKTMALPWRKEKHQKLVFQRPRVEHTLQTLRMQGRISEEEYRAALEQWGKAAERSGSQKVAKV